MQGESGRTCAGELLRKNATELASERAMDTASPDESIPFMQRLYNKIWLLAAAALVFFALSYVVWGLIDIFSVPPG